jgi:putative MATE family efflux protein
VSAEQVDTAADDAPTRTDRAGPSARGLLALAASAFVVLAAEPLYLLVDTAVVGHLGSVPLAGLGLAATLMSLLVMIGTFVEYGTTARAARWFGAGRTEQAVAEGVQASWLAVVIGVLIAGVGELVLGPATAAMAGAGHHAVAHAAESWLRVTLLGVPGVLLVLAGNGWMRGVQETRQPVRIVVLANALSAAASPLLVYTAGWGLVGSAYANLAAQAVGGVLFLRALRRRAASLRPQWSVMRRQLAMGRDLIVRQLGFQLSFLAAAGVASRMGSAPLAAHQVGLQLWTFTALLLDAVAIAAQSLVGAALGAGDVRVARRVTWQVARYGLAFGVLAAAVYGAGWAVLPGVFSSTPQVITQLHVLWPWFLGMLPAAGVLFAVDGVLIGAGDVRFMAWLTVVASFGAFTPLSLAALHWRWGLGGVWAGLTAFILVRLVGMLLRVRGDRWLVTGTGPRQRAEANEPQPTVIHGS